MNLKTRQILILVLIAIFGLFIGWSWHKHFSKISYVQPQDEKVENTVASTTILFVGDVMLDRGVRNNIEKYGPEYPFTDIKSLLSSTNLTVGNLEGTFTNNESISQKDHNILRFTFEPSLAATLKSLGFDGFSMANNHALDFHQAGLDNTRLVLGSNNLFYFGAPLNNSELSSSITVNEEKFCFVGYHALFVEDTTSVINEIKRIRSECDYLTVMAHWGEEYQDEENNNQRNEGRSFIDAGADLVIGGHPHVVQPVEIYKDKAIFYSLGNFVFDQDFSIPTRQGLAVRLTLTEDSQEFHLIPVEMSHAKLYYPEKEAYQARMNILISKLPAELKTTADVDSVFIIPR